MKKLKFLFLFLIAFLFLTSQSFAFGIIGHQGWRLVANGTASAANTQLSLVATTAFVYLVGTDLSAYQTGKHYINIYNQSTGLLIAGGFCSATPPAGQTLSGSELVTNGTFDDNVTGWSVSGDGATLASSHPAGGGQSDDYAILTGTAPSYANFYQSVTIGAGKLVYYSEYVKSGTGGNISYEMGINGLLSGTSSGSWVQRTQYLTGTSGEAVKGGYFASVAGTMLFDEASVQQVIDPPATGLRITSTKGGATQSWTTTGSGAVNAAITYKIYYCGD